MRTDREVWRLLVTDDSSKTGIDVSSGEKEALNNEFCCILSPCLFNLYAEYITRNAGLDEVQAGIKTVGTNINNLRYADDTTLMVESEVCVCVCLFVCVWVCVIHLLYPLIC